MTYSEQPLYIKLPVRVCNALFRAYACGFAASAFMLLRWRRIKLVSSFVVVKVGFHRTALLERTELESSRMETYL